MYFLVRKLTGRGAQEALEQDYQGDALTLGGDDALVPLPGVGGVLRLEPDKQGGARFGARKVEVSVDDQVSIDGTLAPGQLLKLPGYHLSVIAAPPGFDLAVQLESVAGALPAYVGSMDLAEGTWSMRGASWLLASLVLLLFGVVPALGLFDEGLARTLRSAPVPDDGLWSSGPLASAHRTAGVAEDCNACHQQPFQMVTDDACLDCHRETTEHVDLAVHAAEDFTGTRCASCHREHNEPAHIIARGKGLCVDCHGSPGEWQSSDMEPVQGFSAADHPVFRLALLLPQGPGGAHGWEVRRERMDDRELRERSNLKFTHRVHLDPGKVREDATGESLACDSCHSLKDDGEHFEMITMDAHCRSCHGLSFDVFEPTIELPHGDLRAAIVAMEAHFIREFTDPALRAQRAGEKPRRVPGKRQAAASCQGSGLDCGRAEALKEAEYQFMETGCVTCHEVSDTGLRDINDRWYVQPVRLSGDWYPFSRFDHSSHLSLADESGDGVCLSCHAAADSDVSGDVLIPGRDNCLACHAEEEAGASVECVSCHLFHQPGATRALQARESGHE